MRVATSILRIAVVGNPNTGKSTLFSALAGVRQRTGNYPGVTVEKKIGRLELAGVPAELVDLPGTYSLAPRSPDEMVAVDVLLGRREDEPPVGAVLVVVDASNLERNLYLLSQVLELGLPTVVALNMSDVARTRGIVIDVPRLARQLGVPVVEVQANKSIGIAPLREALAGVAARPPRSPESPFAPVFQAEVLKLQEILSAGGQIWPRFLVERLLLDVGGYLEARLLAGASSPAGADVHTARARLAAAGLPVPAVEAIARYAWVSRVLEGVLVRPAERVRTASDHLDRVLTNRFFGTLVFVLLMVAMFSAVFQAAQPAMTAIEDSLGWVGQQVESLMSEGALRSLLVDGVIGGVGSVLVFLPQIMILFVFIAVLEDCGYMARAAYLMDKLMTRVGLSGKSFIPLLSSFACAIPGIMAARVIENRRDRLTTILVAPLMSCSARLPVYSVMIAAFVPPRAYLNGLLPLQGLTLAAMYFLGIAVAAVVALVLKRTLLAGGTPPFVMELPSYKWPSPRVVVWRVLERAWSFLTRAGTLILAVAILVWAATYYPHDVALVEAPFADRKQQLEVELAAAADDAPRLAEVQTARAELDNAIIAAYQQQSWLGRAGKWIEPAVRPLGWDWRIGCAVIASFPAREVVVGTLGVIYNLGPGLDVGSDSAEQSLTDRLRDARWDETGEPVYNLPVALSIMVFFALCAQCASTLAVIRRETNSRWWPVFAFVYMTALAYLGALATYQTGMWLSG